MSGQGTGRKHRHFDNKGYSKLHLATLAVISAGSFYTAESARGAAVVFNAVGVLDPLNNTGTTTGVNLTDATGYTNGAGVSFANFSTLVGNAFNAGNGGVFNFESTSLVSGTPGTNVTGAASPFQANIQSSGNAFSFYDNSPLNDINTGLGQNTTTGTYLASGGNGTPGSAGYYLGEANNVSTMTLAFNQGLADFGITFLPRSNASARVVSLTANFSNGTSSTTNQATTDAGNVQSNAAVFFGFQAPTGTTITSVTFNNPTSTNLERFDDLAFVLPTVAAGTPYYWTAATNTSWAANNWSSDAAGATSVGAIPTNGVAAVVFASTAASVTVASLNTTLGANQNVSSITVSTGVGAVSVGGTQSLTIGAGGISLTSGEPLTISTTGQVVLAANQNWSSGTTTGSTITVSSPISGPGTLGLGGMGSFVLSGSNTYTGGTFLKAGTLQLQNAAALGAPSGALNVNGGTLDLNGYSPTIGLLNGTGGVITTSAGGLSTLTVAGSANGSFGGVLNDGGSGHLALVQSGPGQLILQGSSTYSGGTSINGGELRALTNPATAGITVTPFGTGTVSLNSGLLSLYSGAGGNVPYFGNNFNLAGGRLSSNDGDVHLTGTVNVTGNTTIERTYTSTGITGKKLNFDGALTGSGNLTLYNINGGFGQGGYVAVNGAGNSYNGTITVNTIAKDPNDTSTNTSNGVALVIGNATALQNATIDVEGNGTTAIPWGLQFYAPDPAAGPGVTLGGSATIGALQGNGEILLQDQDPVSGGSGPNALTLITGNNNASTTYSGNLNGSGGLSKIGNGNFTISGTNSYTGVTTVSGGILGSSSSAIPAASTITFGGGTLQHSTGNLTDYSAQIQNSSSPIAIDTNGQNITYATSLSGSNSAGLTKLGAGTLSLPAAANYGGDTNINNGTLKITSINSTGTVYVNSSNVGSGVLTAFGSATIAGAANVASGGTIDLRNGTMDTLNINQGLTLNGGSVLGLDLGSPGSNDSINLGSSSTYTFNGTSGTTIIDIARTAGFGPGTYNLITNAVGIQASNFQVGNPTSGYAFNLSGADLGGATSNDTLVLTVVSTVPVVEYWHGGRAGTGTVWSAVSGSTTNFDTDQTSNVSTTSTPGLPTAVIFAANAASAANDSATTLGADTLVKSIEIQTSSPVGIGGANSLTIDQGITLDSGAGATTISTSAIVLNTDQSWTNNSVNPLAMSANISGTGRALTITGTGTTLLSGANTFNGSMGVNAGATLSLGSAQAMGLGALTDNGTLDLNGQTTAVTPSVSGSGIVTNSNVGLGTLTLAGGTFAGSFQDGIGKTAVNLSSGTLVLTGTSTATGGTTIGATATLQLGNGVSAGGIAGAIAGSGTISINSPSPVVFSGSNTFTGLIDVIGGTLQSGSILALGAPGAKLTINGGTVDLHGFNNTISSLNGGSGSVTSNAPGTSVLSIAATAAAPGSYVGAISDGVGKVAVAINAGGILTLTDVNNNYSGGTVVNGGGTLNIGDSTNNLPATPDNTLGTGPVTIGSATTPVATLSFRTQINGGAVVTHTYNNSFSVIGNSLIQAAEGTNVIAGSTSFNGSNNTIGILLNDKPLILTGSLSGTGNVTLVGYGKALVNTGFGGGGYVGIGSNVAGGAVNNTAFTGTLFINNSPIAATNASGGSTNDNTHGVQIVALQNAFLPDGTISFSADLPWVGVGPTINGYSFNNSSAITFAVNITSPQIGALSSATGGSIALATQTYQGVNLTLGLNNSTGSTYAGNLFDNSAATVNTSSGSLTKIGTNQQILTGTNYYIGGTTVNGGSLVLDSAGAYPNNGSTGTALTIGPSGLLQLANHGSASTFVPIVSTLSNAGTIDLTNNAMILKNANNSIGIIYAEIQNAFHNGTWNGTNSASGVITSTLAQADTTHLTAVGIATGLTSFEGRTVAAGDVLLKYTYYGDANLDGSVSSSDYTLIDAGFLSNGGLTGWSNGDFNYDGVVNGSDYTLIDNAFNTQGAQIASVIATPTGEIAGSTGVSSVPEPATLSLIGIAAAGLLGRRRRGC